MKYGLIFSLLLIGSLTSCQSNQQRPGADYDQFHIDSIVDVKIDSFKKVLNKRTDSLLLESSQQYIDSLKWADSLLNTGKNKSAINE